MNTPSIDLKALIGAGFARAATWRRDPASSVSLLGEFPSSPGLYLFVEDDVIQYIGSASDGLLSRMRRYQRRQGARNSTRPVHASLAEAFNRGASIAVFVKVLSDADQCEWNGLPVDIMLGVEAALIKTISPPWNRRGRPLLTPTAS